MSTVTISKAEAQRRKDAFNTLHSRINMKMTDFREMYYQAHVNYEMNQLKNRLKACQESTEEIFRGTKRTSLIAMIEDQIERKQTLSFRVLNEANESFEAKLNKVVQKCVDFGINNYMNMKVERLASESSSEFSFLISNYEIEVHARVIYANGEINVPHFRFITTKRNK
tara:strand:- start:8 stop:514 length:507 start_codon:yes stop_codon:yes gene_type:complete